MTTTKKSIAVLVDHKNTLIIEKETLQKCFEIIETTLGLNPICFYCFFMDDGSYKIQTTQEIVITLKEISEYAKEALFFSDLIGDLWSNYSGFTFLRNASKEFKNLSLFQPLDSEIWNRTGLRACVSVEIEASTKRTGLITEPLVIKKINGEPRVPFLLEKALLLPILTLRELTEENFKSRTRWNGYLIPRVEDCPPDKKYDPNEHKPERTPEERVNSFLKISSPTSRNLAYLLINVPYFTLPFLHEVSKELKPMTVNEKHIQEVLLGGIFRLVSGGINRPDQAIFAIVHERIPRFQSIIWALEEHVEDSVEGVKTMHKKFFDKIFVQENNEQLKGF